MIKRILATLSLLLCLNCSLVYGAGLFNNTFQSKYLISSNALAGKSAYTICFWIRAYSVLDSYIYGDPAGNKDAGYINSVGLPVFYTGGGLIAATNRFDSTTNWVHLAVTWSTAGSGASKLYINGVLHKTGAGGTTVPSWSQFSIGGVGGSYSTCVLDDFRGYWRILTKNEIAEIFGCNGNDTIVPDFQYTFLEQDPVTASSVMPIMTASNVPRPFIVMDAGGKEGWKASDGNTATYSGSAPTGRAWTCTSDRPRQVTRLVAIPYSGQGISNFNVQCSVDGVTWIEMYTNAMTSSGYQYFTLPSVGYYQWWRIVPRSSYYPASTSMFEMRFYDNVLVDNMGNFNGLPQGQPRWAGSTLKWSRRRQ